jgi:hypothetical protein
MSATCFIDLFQCLMGDKAFVFGPARADQVFIIQAPGFGQESVQRRTVLPVIPQKKNGKGDAVFFCDVFTQYVQSFGNNGPFHQGDLLLDFSQTVRCHVQCGCPVQHLLFKPSATGRFQRKCLQAFTDQLIQVIVIVIEAGCGKGG